MYSSTTIGPIVVCSSTLGAPTIAHTFWLGPQGVLAEFCSERKLCIAIRVPVAAEGLQGYYSQDKAEQK